MAEPKEPQSYGSEAGWVKGETSQEVNQQKGEASSHPEFYESRRDGETSEEHQGGNVSPEQTMESETPSPAATVVDRQPVQSMSDNKGGSKMGSYFKKRDYD